MPYESPYHDPSPQEKQGREWVGRAAMLVVALVLLYVGINGVVHTHAAQVAATQPVAGRAVTPDDPVARSNTAGVPLLWLLFLVLIVGGGITAVLALLPTSAMERLFAPFNSAPITGDRAPGLDDRYRDINSPHYRAPTARGRLFDRLRRRR